MSLEIPLHRILLKNRNQEKRIKVANGEEKWETGFKS